MIIGILSFLIVLIVFLFFVYPRLSVEPGESLDLQKPFETPFIVKNDGYWPLVDVSCELAFDKLEDINSKRFTHLGNRDTANNIPKLWGNESFSIFINRSVGTPPEHIKYVELYINVTYRPFLIPITFTENKRFKTNRKPNDEYIWSKILSKK